MSVTQSEPTKIRAVKCKFGPITRRYQGGEWHDVEQHDHCRRGVIAGLDNSHNGDYKVAYASSPLLVIHTGKDLLHSELRDQLKELDLWSDTFSKIELPRTERDGSMTWIAGFKTLPRDSGRIDQYKQQLKEASDGFALESQFSIEVTV